eukprot:CAMPEP_0113573000 /NCGR_PEP_ID=MMETSP0015_2-20120614/26385_1 /TAXON_ID=2838 /ORGANISM="Odontella" /LENGTH=553 /DNA_ID=CAMNT_0000476051 /DNA_START=128 /DNA_END=1789 /DNA_ORIENTATION=- /assembly_acc=CAM_ASM_000160
MNITTTTTCRLALAALTLSHSALFVRSLTIDRGVIYLTGHRQLPAEASSTTSLNALPPPPTSNVRSASLRGNRAFAGRPSTPGWATGQLDKLTDWVQTDEANRPVICEYEPDGTWLWSQWKGTVLYMCVMPVVLSMVAGVIVDAGVHQLSSAHWPLLSVPPADDPLIQQLAGINGLWEYQLTLATFILTFFTQTSYNYWKTVYLTTRAIQGRINDICMLISMGAERGSERCIVKEDGLFVAAKGVNGINGANGASKNGKSKSATAGAAIANAGPVTECVTGYSDDASELVRRCARLIRLSHTFFWAVAPTCSNGVTDGNAFLHRSNNEGNGGGSGYGQKGEGDAEEKKIQEIMTGRAIGPLLLSPRGLRRLVVEGELTANEQEALLDSGLPPSQYAYILLEWVGLHVMNGIRDGTLRGDNGFEENLLRQFCMLRAEYFNIGDYAAGRMPLAYVQLVQVLVDCLVVLAPLALYSDLGSLSIPLTGLLTLFFKGLLELSKSFLDPFGNEGYPDQNIRVDVLVSELNFGAGSRWVQAGEVLPSSIDGIDSIDRRRP